jgi:hypothetical protein
MPLQVGPDGLRRNSKLLKQRSHDPVFLRDQGIGQMLRLELRAFRFQRAAGRPAASWAFMVNLSIRIIKISGFPFS